MRARARQLDRFDFHRDRAGDFSGWLRRRDAGKIFTARHDPRRNWLRGAGAAQQFGGDRATLRHRDFAVGDNPSMAIGLNGVLIGVLVRENFLLAGIGIGHAAAATSAGSIVVDIAPTAAVLTTDLVVQDNTMECVRCGINFDALSLHAFQTRLAGNVIVGCSGGHQHVGLGDPGFRFGSARE